MKSGKTFLSLCIFMLIPISPATAETVNFRDGQSHLINDNLHQNDLIELDYYTNNNPGTHLEIINGGSVNYVRSWSNSTVNFSGGLISTGLEARDYSRVDISDGSIGDTLYSGDNSIVTVSNVAIAGELHTANNSMVSFNSGTIGGHLKAWGDSTVSFSNGTIEGWLIGLGNSTIAFNGGSANLLEAVENGTVKLAGGTIENQLFAFGTGKIYLYGSNFSINGQQLNYGDSLRNFGYTSGTIKGTLLDGSQLNNAFVINTGQGNPDADIIVAPEPATLLLFAFGGIALRRKH